MRRIVRTFVVVGLVVVVSGSAVAQEAGTIEGRVVGRDGAALFGVLVEVVESRQVDTTDARGSFRIAGVPPGSYTVRLSLEGQVETIDDVRVAAGETIRLDRDLDWRVRFLESITVYGVSRQVERVVDAPAAVTVVTEEEIEQRASHGQLPKLLEFTPGAELTQSGVYDFNFNTRGFNSSLNRRVATLIDGRNPSVPFLASQEWSAIPFPLDELAAAELLRGPSAALYGANATGGVLNLLTKTPRLSEGGRARVTGGELSTLNADLRWAGHLGGDFYGRVLGGYRESGDFTVSRVGQAEYTEPCPPGVTGGCLPQEVVPPDPLDDVEIWFAGARLDYDRGTGHVFTAEGGTLEAEGPVVQTGIGRVQVQEVDRPWGRLAYTGPNWHVFGSITQREAPRQLALASAQNLALDDERRQLEAQTHWSLAQGRGRVVVGASYQEEDIDSRDPRTGRQTLLFEPVDTDSKAVFGQFDWSLSDQWKIVAAARWDDSTLYSSQFSPKGGLVFSPNPNHTLRLTYNEAFQVANYSEFFLVAPAAPPVTALAPIEAAFCEPFGVTCGFAPAVPIVAVGNEALEVEDVRTVEVGWNAIVADRGFLTLDYHFSRNKDFITDLLPQLGTPFGRINPAFGLYQPPAALPPAVQAALLDTLQAALGPTFFILSNAPDGSPLIVAASYTNFGDVDTQGVDLGFSYYWPTGWNANFTYSWFDFRIKDAQPGFEDLLLPNSPEHRIAAGLGYTASDWDGSLSLRWVDDFRWFVGPFQGEVESYTVVDLVANWHLTEHVSLGINVANLFDSNHWEAFGGDRLGRRALGSVAVRW